MGCPSSISSVIRMRTDTQTNYRTNTSMEVLRVYNRGSVGISRSSLGNFNKLPTILPSYQISKEFCDGWGAGWKKEKKQRGKRCVSRNALSWVLSPFFPRHFLYDNSSDYKPTHGQKKLLESHFPSKRAPTNNRPKSPGLHFALPSPSVFMELLCQVQKKQFILNSHFPSLEHNKLPSPRHSANLWCTRLGDTGAVANTGKRNRGGLEWWVCHLSAPSASSLVWVLLGYGEVFGLFCWGGWSFLFLLLMWSRGPKKPRLEGTMVGSRKR